MTPDQIAEVLRLHGMWLRDNPEGVRADLTRADLTGADLTGATLTGANLTRAYLTRANLTRADLTGAYLTDAYLHGANLTRANLTGAYLTGANLTGANLTGAYLTGANLTRAYLTRANLTGAILWGTIGNMREVKSAQLDKWPLAWTRSPDDVDWLQIGCQRHPLHDWAAFSDEEIAAMEDDALAWWGKHRDPVLRLVEASPATPWGTDE